MSREEWLALPSAEARDAWVAALAAAAAPEKSARDESFALDDDVWADAAQTAAPAGVGGASVYDYSIVREGWRVRVTYHVLVTVDGPAAGAAQDQRAFRAVRSGTTGEGSGLTHSPRDPSRDRHANQKIRGDSTGFRGLVTRAERGNIHLPISVRDLGEPV